MAKYEVQLRLDGKLIGNIRQIAEGLKWSKSRTRMGVDSISFTVNDMLLADWCRQRNTTVPEILRPLALDCRVIRNGVELVGGYLATMPAYSPTGQSASLPLSFDGYLNYVSKVYLHPQPPNQGALDTLIQKWMVEADERASRAGKAFGFKPGKLDALAKVEQSIENYTAIKDIITNRCDNLTGAGPFEVYFHPDRTYDIIKDSNFGNEITDYIIIYPAQINGVVATSISAKEVTGFASAIIGIGSGETKPGSENPAITSIQTNSEAVKLYGYAESTLSESSVSVQDTLDRNVQAELNNRSNLQWQPEIKLTGVQVSPVPSGKRKIWIGDTVKLQDNEDQTGMASGEFRVNVLEVSVDANDAEEIVPTLSRGDAINISSFAQDFVRMKNELLALKTGK